MAESRFLKIVTYGGYDKADVVHRLDSLNEQVFALENELRETKLLLDSSKDGKDIMESIDSLLADERKKLTEAQTKNEELALRLETAEEEKRKAEEEIKKLKASLEEVNAKLADANTQLAAASSDDEAIALSTVFIEAKKSATLLEDTAKEKAEEIESSAAAAADRSVAIANDESAMIIYEAQCKAAEIIADAKNAAAEITNSDNGAREAVLSRMSDLSGRLRELREALDKFGRDSAGGLGECEELLGKTEENIRKEGASAANEPAKFAPEYPERPQRTADLDSPEIAKPKNEPDKQKQAEESEAPAENKEQAATADEKADKEAKETDKSADNSKNNNNNNSKNGKIDLASLVKQAKALKDK